ncbi:hypothetical protein [Chryseolinea lacunae]|uniref:Uncharacterized protein n=1 Tax=Chryseolinea lacunae TaxID=2801331 RepID=A0ABS1L0D9_9BACT|nr:hypothetical protein [Chryseolinea lacunae]MBL0744977.1 hypothetical protein [Chryseolinea lacunae]
MRFIFFFTLVLLSCNTSYCQDQPNKLKGFVIGNKAHEKYVAYFNGQWIMSFNGEAYKIYFEVDRLTWWETTGYIREFTFYRETLFGQRKVHFEVSYEGAKKYLVITRERKRSKRHAFVGTWSNEEPELPTVR